MATLKEFEDVLRQRGMVNALAILDELKKRDREQRSVAPARRVVGRKMTAELAHSILDMHATTGMTQQEIAFKLGVNQGRVNEVIKRGKWLSGDPTAPEAQSRDKAMDRLATRAKARRADAARPSSSSTERKAPSSRNVSPVKAAERADAHSRPMPPMLPAEAELPFAQPKANAHPSAVGGVKEAPRRIGLGSPPTPSIVSAQLAFLDL